MILCAFYVGSILRKSKQIQTGEIGLLGLLSGCICMSMVCAVQCLRNHAGGTQRFVDWGGLGCMTEGVGHILGIMVQFLSISTISTYQYWTVTKYCSPLKPLHMQNFPPHKAWVVFGLIWTFSLTGTFCTLPFSTIELQPAGTYCFPSFSSPMVLFMAITMVISCSLTAFLYWRIFALTSNDAETSAMAGTYQRNHKRRVAARWSFLLVVGYILGWGGAVVATVYAWFTGQIEPEMEMQIGVAGISYSLFVPLVYGGPANREARRCCRRIGNISKCCKARCDEMFPEFEDRLKNKHGEVTVVTVRGRPMNEKKSPNPASRHSKQSQNSPNSPNQQPEIEPSSPTSPLRPPQMFLSPTSNSTSPNPGGRSSIST